MSLGWVKQWKKRLQEADPEDPQVLHSRSRARTHPPARISEPVVERIIQMRDAPPEGLQRTPGPKAILYYLPRDEQLQGERLPRLSPDDLPPETTLEAVAELFTRHGLPQAVRIDRDVRFVSSPAGSDFPSAKVALLPVLGSWRAGV
jgi:hypothetical protein